MVLGLEWLDTLEDVVANFRESRLIIEPHNAPRVLQGDPELCYGGVALQSTMRVLEEQGHGFLVQLWPAQQLGDMGNNIPWTLKIQFRPGLENKAADALSWQMMYKAVSVVHSSMGGHHCCQNSRRLSCSKSFELCSKVSMPIRGIHCSRVACSIKAGLSFLRTPLRFHSCLLNSMIQLQGVIRVF